MGGLVQHAGWFTAAGACCALAGALPAAAATDLEALTARWYTVEAVVFQRSGFTWADDPEHLYRTGPRSLPATVRSITAGAPGDGYDLDPLTAATLEFPALSLDCSAVAAAARQRPAGVPARYRPAPPHEGAFSVPAPFDVPVAPERSRPSCNLRPGQPPPAVRPVLEPHPRLAWLNALRRFESLLESTSHRASTQGSVLRRDANRILESAELRLLWHGRWTQQVPPRSAPEPLLIQAGRRIDRVHELEGAIGITLGRYLHFHARLWWNGLPGPGEARATAADGPDGGTEPTPLAYMTLEESRTMRSGTLHYLDHPALGVLVRADPLRAPRWLADASAALEVEQGGD